MGGSRAFLEVASSLRGGLIPEDMRPSARWSPAIRQPDEPVGQGPYPSIAQPLDPDDEREIIGRVNQKRDQSLIAIIVLIVLMMRRH